MLIQDGLATLLRGGDLNVLGTAELTEAAGGGGRAGRAGSGREIGRVQPPTNPTQHRRSKDEEVAAALTEMCSEDLRASAGGG